MSEAKPETTPEKNEPPSASLPKAEHLRRWRLVLGRDAESIEFEGGTFDLEAKEDRGMDKALDQLYGEKGATLQNSTPKVSRWLGDIRGYFPRSVVQLMQKDAFERLGLERLLLEPELLEQVEPDVHLVGTLLSMSSLMSTRTRESARQVVRGVVEELMKKLTEPTRQAVQSAIDRSLRNPRPRFNEIDWPRTIRANLQHYQPEYRTIIPEKLIGYGRRRRQGLKRVILAIDQSGSMASSVVYSAIFGAVLASIPTLSTRLVVFDTKVVDLTEELDDPVDILFSTQLGGGTDINRAVAYCQEHIENPEDTVFVLISDLYEGGVEAQLLRRCQEILSSGATLVVLLALSDGGAPYYDAKLAAKIAALGAPAFACTPDHFPDLMAAALTRQNIAAWAAERDLVITRAEE